MRLKVRIPARAAALILALTAIAAPAWAQSAEIDDTKPAVGVQYALIGIIAENDGTSKFGFDANYATKMLTEPATSLGIRVGGIAEFGYHHFDDGGGLTLIQGGVQLRSDRIRTPRVIPSARVMVGLGHYPEGTDFNFILMPGLDFPLQGRPFRARFEAGQVWDVFDGGKLAHWRYGFGIVMPLDR